MRIGERIRQRERDEAAASYDPGSNDWQDPIEADPRCLWGWGGPDCRHMLGHACFRALGHPGRCGDPDERRECPSTRPADWDSSGRAEANA